MPRFRLKFKREMIETAEIELSAKDKEQAVENLWKKLEAGQNLGWKWKEADKFDVAVDSVEEIKPGG